ncbi:MAG TPA: hypothetical protein VGM88_18320 [Kofleriaceae bacterium]|jgi:hypothetical protein
MDRTLPPALAEANAMTYDYDDGNGFDFEPYDQFLDADETTEWIRGWTGSDRLTGEALRVFGQDGTGGYAAIWLARDGKPLAAQPIVFLGSEGERGVVAANLADYLWVLAGGFGPYEAIAYGGSTRELQMEFADLAAKHAPDAEKPARDAIRLAGEAFPDFAAIVDTWCH